MINIFDLSSDELSEIKEALDIARKEMPFDGVCSPDLLNSIVERKPKDVLLSSLRHGPNAHFHHLEMWRSTEVLRAEIEKEHEKTQEDHKRYREIA